jgi:hypothetical protein
MDMIVFPYNDMFSSQIQHSTFKKCYFVKLNNDRIKFTDFPYWKKDILEQAPLKYVNYINNNNQNQLSFFLKSKIHDSSTLFFWESKLAPIQKDPSDWLIWYIRFSGNKINKSDSISLVEYNVSIATNFPILMDSFIICKTITK